MNRTSIAACVCFLGLMTGLSWGEPPCRVRVKPVVEVAGSEVALSDLFARDTCPELLQAAARVRLGKAPLAGSARVFEGDSVRALLQKLVQSQKTLRDRSMAVPERVVLRSAEIRASCEDIRSRTLGSTLEKTVTQIRPAFHIEPGDELQSLSETDCGAAGRISRDVPLQIIRKNWNAALHRWEVLVRCTRPLDCVPFLVTAPEANASEFESVDHRLNSPASTASNLRPGVEPMVRAGQAATLLWEQNGIRLVIPAVCLDSGAKGETVRARIIHSRRTLRAIVVNAGNLRAIS